MKKITIIIIVLVILFGTGLLLLKKNSGKSLENSTTTGSEIKTIDDWKTLVNEKFGYSVKYPSNFSAPTQNDLGNWITIANRKFENNNDRPYPMFYVYVFSMTKGDWSFVGGRDLKEWIEKNFNDKKSGKAEDLKPVVFNGLQGFYFKNRNLGGAMAQFENVALSDGENVYLLESVWEDDNDPTLWMTSGDFMKAANSFRLLK